MRARKRKDNRQGMKDASVSLVDELEGLADVIESAQLIAEFLVNGTLPDDDAVNRAPKMLEAMLALASSRLRLVRKVVLREADAGLIRGRRNTRQPPVQRWEDPDVLLGKTPTTKRR